MENCNAPTTLCFDDFELFKYLQFYNAQAQLSLRDPDPRVKDSGTTLVSHGFEIRLETGCKIREKSKTEERRKREPPWSGGLLLHSLRLDVNVKMLYFVKHSMVILFNAKKIIEKLSCKKSVIIKKTSTSLIFHRSFLRF